MERTSTSAASAADIEKLNRQWMQAYVERDTAFLRRHLADDYVSTFPDGTVLDKQAEIDALASGAVVLTEMTPRAMDVRLYGSAAVITGRSSIVARVNGQEERGDYRFTDVWVQREGGWQAVASQVTRIAKP
jgi:ketosteroid isomerase-like protein